LVDWMADKLVAY
jgi:hypothetical protein